MTLTQLVVRSLRYYGKGHAGLAFGAFLAAAVLSGSLLVGDSVRASLRRAAEARLGGVVAGVIGGDRWFTASLARQAGGAPLIVADGAVSAAAGGVRVNAVQVLGVEAGFWALSPGGKAVAIGRNEVAVNATLAARLGASSGDTVIVRLEQPSAISRDAPLSGSTNQEVSLRRVIGPVLSPDQFGAFQLTATQRMPDTVVFNLEDLQLQLEMQGRVNTLLADAAAAEGLGGRMEAVKQLEDFALTLQKVAGDVPEWQVGTDRVFLDEALALDLLKRERAYGVLTYLVNGIASAKGGTPYSMVAAVDERQWERRFGAAGGARGAVISQWLAEDQGLNLGDELTLRYYVVGTGRALQEADATFTVDAVLPMDRAVLNREWTPRFPGVSDVDNCRDWDPGIPMDTAAIRDQDEKYWDDFGATPKVFIGLEAGKALWKNRFGSLTSVRFPDTGEDETMLRTQLVSGLRLDRIGLAPRDLRGAAAAAARGSVDFGGLFVGLSLFLIAGALVFAALLFVFTLERRAGQMGLLMALGWTARQVRRALLLEAGWIAVLGVLLGAAAGGFYTRLALRGLSGVWSGAVPGLELVYAPGTATMAVSAAAALLVVMAVLWWSSRRIFNTPPRALLAGEWSEAAAGAPIKAGVWPALIGALGAAGMLWQGTRTASAEVVAGLFFGGGMLLLLAGLLLLRAWMRRGARRCTGAAMSLVEIGLRGVSRRPARSLAVAGMMAAGIFLVTAVNAFRLSAGGDPARRDTGTGGFALIGESSLPVYESLTEKAGMEAFGLDEEIMKEVGVVPFRVLEGDDASCLNLNRAQKPVLTGVNAALLAERGAFAFASGGEAGWKVLDYRPPEMKPPAGVTDALQPERLIPAIADQATAMWGLGLGVGDTLDYEDAQGRKFRVVLVGLLAGSVLQGKIIIAEESFLEKYPNAPGYRFFLIDAPGGRAEEVSTHLTRQLEKRGLALEPAQTRLLAFMTVQNTYIGIFTVLGGLGVLLGTAGLGVLVARHVLERRGELGLMQALGFRRAALRGLMLGEHALLLAAGLTLGVVSALVAVWPGASQNAQELPWGFLSWLWAAVLVFGLAVCLAAVTGAVRGRLLEAVRRE